MRTCNFQALKVEQRTGRHNSRLSVFLSLGPADAALRPILRFQQRRRLFATRFLLTMTLPPSFVCLNPSLSLSLCLSRLHSFQPRPFLLWRTAALSSTVLSHPRSPIFPRTRSNGLSSVSPPLTVLQGTSEPRCVVWDYGNP